ncbi:N-6 DNA methylase [Leptolyngbya sp. BL0902]|uniref:class I SAM-dependent DNA methyltransferase n=1 Tax=Leptolyngbya sp. BL0902 TaxID=1115757 RepID=UPI0018E73B8B|nr:N-6 DNA methylase [Leptolyngbya sp. BL0902]QQE66707.1 N-6 DNA methylase [Leptolyngbya sp. BL0902]
MAKTSDSNGKTSNGRLFTTQQSLDSYVKSICDIMRRSNCAGALQYVPELTWILFLRILDELEAGEQDELEALGQDFKPSIGFPYRWREWAAPHDEDPLKQVDGLPQGWKRKELTDGAEGEFFKFLHTDLIPHLKALKTLPDATPRQKVISEILSSVERTRIDTEKNFLDILDKVHNIHLEGIDPTHIFPLSQVYEGLLLKMGEKGNDGGQFFTPRVVIRAMVKAIDPKIGETIYDPGCGTGGFLAEGFNHIRQALGDHIDADQQETLKYKTFYGREKDNAIYPIALANLVLHGIDLPHLWHGNTLTGGVTYDGLYDGAPSQFDVLLMNPPFGGKEDKAAQTDFAYKTSSTQALFLQHTLAAMKNGGRCGIVLDEGILFRTNETAFVQTKRKLLDDCDVWAIVSLPPGVFTAAGAGVKTNLVFFTKGKPTESIWYYDLSDRKVTKKKPLLDKDFDPFFELLPSRGDSDCSWTVTRADIEAKNFDLKAVNPNKVNEEDDRTPTQLLDIIEAKGKEVEAALAKLRG